MRQRGSGEHRVFSTGGRVRSGQRQSGCSPVLRVSQEGGAWRAEALALLSFRDLFLRIEEGSPFPAGPMQPWAESAEGDTASVWYAIPKGADQGPIRRIELPESFSPRDVNATHVWGGRYAELDVTYVAGRRLVRSS